MLPYGSVEPPMRSLSDFLCPCDGSSVRSFVTTWRCWCCAFVTAVKVPTCNRSEGVLSAMSRFELEKHDSPRSCVVRLSGDIDMAMVPELRRDLSTAIEGGCAHLVLDLSEVVYADSSALGLLVWLDHQLRPGGGRMVLAGANLDITRILELSGLVTVASTLAMSPNVEGALEGLGLSSEPAQELWRQELEMRASVDNLGAMREEVCELIKPLGFAESAVFDIRVALGEALANAVRHGSPASGDASVLVRVIAYDDRVVIEVIDLGAGFDGTSSQSSDVYAPGGRGVTFMRALTDRVEFERPEGGGTLVRLVKHRGGGQT